MAKSTEERVKGIVVEQFGITGDKLKPESRFIEDLGGDSLDAVELMMAFEEEFDIPEITDEDADKLATIGSVIRYVDERQNTDAKKT